MKKSIQIRVDENTVNALKSEAKTEKRSFSNHCDNVLTQHVSKKETSNPHTPKKEVK